MPSRRVAPGADPPPDPRRWRALAVCLVAGFMTLLDVSIVNVALPRIRDSLDPSPGQLQWVLSGYALTFGLALVPAGRLGDARGRRVSFMAGVVVFTAASAACGAAASAEWLVAARLLQGLGGGLITPQVAGLIQALFRGAERGRAFGLLGASIGLSTAIGPLLGGVIITGIGTDDAWRWVFYVNLPVGLAALPLAWWLIPAELGSGRRESLDPVGILLLGGGLTLVLLPLLQTEGGQGPGPGPLLLAAPGLGLASLAGFVAWERHHRRRGRAPLVDLDLFRVRSYAAGTSLGLAYFAGFTSIFFVLTLYLQSGLGYDPLQAGLTTTPFAVGGTLAAGIGGRWVTRVGRRIVVAGLVASAVGLVAADVVVALVPEGPATGWALLVPLLVAGTGSGLVISPNQTLTLAEVPVRGAGSAAGVLQTGQRIGSAFGIAVVGAVFFAVLGPEERWDDAISAGLRVSVGFTIAALVLGLLDLRPPRRRRRPAAAAGS